MKKVTKKGKGIIVIFITITVILFTGITALGAAFPDNPILQFFVIENPFTTPQQETFSILQIFEENGFSKDRIDNIQIDVLPDGGTIIITNQKHIQAVWDVLSETKVTTLGAEQAQINDELVTYVQFQFLNPNYSLGIEMFGQVYVLGRGPFIFAEGSSEQPFIDLFTEFASIHVDITQSESIEQYSGIEILVDVYNDSIEFMEDFTYMIREPVPWERPEGVPERSPNLYVSLRAGELSIQNFRGAQGTTSWLSYQATGVHPLYFWTESMNDIDFSKYRVQFEGGDSGEIELRFSGDFSPDTLTVKRWRAEFIGISGMENRYEIIEINDNVIYLIDNGFDYIYEVIARWSWDGDLIIGGCGGQAQYTFRVDSAK